MGAVRESAKSSHLGRLFGEKDETQGGRWLCGLSNKCFVSPDTGGHREKKGKGE